jgi:hypothetical protein
MNDLKANAKTITLTNYWALKGLLTLARRHNRALREIEEAACELTGDQPSGLTADAIYNDNEASELLDWLHIEVGESSQ